VGNAFLPTRNKCHDTNGVPKGIKAKKPAHPTKFDIFKLCCSDGIQSLLQHYQEKYIMTILNRITVDPNLCGGRPCIRNMRIRVKDILDLLAADASTAEILEDYPYLEADDIKAALSYAAHQMDHPILRVA
jgi:uncharacterized protein (DUF433 family)